MDYALLALSVFATVVNTSLRNKFGKTEIKNMSDSLAFNSVVSAAAVVVLLILGKGFSHASTFTVVLGIIFGFVIAAEMIVILKALAIGSMSYTTLIDYCGMLIPTFSGMLFWNETVKPAQYVGIVLMVLSFVLGVNPKKDKRITPKWIILSMTLFCLSGSMGVIQKVHQTSAYSSELSECLIIAFSVTTVILVVMYLFSNRLSEKRTVSVTPKFISCAILSGVCMALIHHINIYLSGRLESAFFFPTINGACIMATVIASVIVFREKLTKLQIISLIIGVLAILLVGNITDLIF